MTTLQGLPKMDMLGESDPFVKVYFIKIIVYIFLKTNFKRGIICFEGVRPAS